MSSIKLNEENFENEVMRSDKPVLIDFYADWCGPCRAVAPVVEEIASEKSEYKICKVNVDDEPALAQRFGVSSIPTLVAVRNGQIASRSVGARPKAEILSMLEN